MDEYKSVTKYQRKKQLKKDSSTFIQKNSFRSYLLSFISRFLISVILLLGALIGCKNPTVKSFINEQIYHTNIQFAPLKEWYQKNIGNVFPLQSSLPDTTPVFSEQLTYRNKRLYKDGVSLEVGTNYLVPVLESGIVVFIGEKEDYGATVIIQQVNGVDLWYSNINASNLSLYEYVEKGSLLGEANGNEIYLVFQKEGAFLNYQDYLE